MQSKLVPVVQIVLKRAKAVGNIHGSIVVGVVDWFWAIISNFLWHKNWKPALGVVLAQKDYNYYVEALGLIRWGIRVILY